MLAIQTVKLHILIHKASDHLDPLAEWLRMLIFSALNCSSSHCCGFEPSSGHVRKAKFCLQVVTGIQTNHFDLGVPDCQK